MLDESCQMKEQKKSSVKSLLNSFMNLFRLSTVVFTQSALYHMYFFKMSNKNFRGLNLGSGGYRINDFCNIDAMFSVKNDIIATIERIKLRSNSVGTIYSSHAFEHLPRAQAKEALAEWHRVLKADGKLYICVPDVETLFKIYLENLSSYDTEVGKLLVERAIGLVYGFQANKWDVHYYGYSFNTLKTLLESVGFKNVQRFNRSELQWAPSWDVSMGTLKQHWPWVDVEDQQVSLNVEAIKQSP
jgi:predicted SAM-dependent methyltransferase